MKRKKKTAGDLREYIVKHLKWHNAKSKEWKLEDWFYLTFGVHRYDKFNGEDGHFMPHVSFKDAIEYLEHDLPLKFLDARGGIENLQLLIIICHLDLDTNRLEYKLLLEGYTEDWRIYTTLI